MKTIIILPVYNEETTLKDELDRLTELADFIIIVNDGSTDNSAEILDKYCKRSSTTCLINHPSNSGKSQALLNGFTKIMEMLNNGEFEPNDLLVITDADGQLPADAIPDAVKYFRCKNLDMLIGARDFQKYPFIKRLGNRILSFTASILSGFSFRDTQCGFRIATLSAIEKILPFYTAQGYACEQQLSQIAALSKLNIDNSFPIKPVYYRSNSTFADAFKIAFDSLLTFVRMKILKQGKQSGRKVLNPVLSKTGSANNNKIEI